jgi:hypothetical protein
MGLTIKRPCESPYWGHSARTHERRKWPNLSGKTCKVKRMFDTSTPLQRHLRAWRGCSACFGSADTDENEPSTEQRPYIADMPVVLARRICLCRPGASTLLCWSYGDAAVLGPDPTDERPPDEKRGTAEKAGWRRGSGSLRARAERCFRTFVPLSSPSGSRICRSPAPHRGAGYERPQHRHESDHEQRLKTEYRTEQTILTKTNGRILRWGQYEQ